jgi:hypothetical protein
MPNFGRCEFACRRAQTIDAYAGVARGGVEKCGCAHCRNFALARARAYPAEFLRLLDELGIDPRKEAEVYHNGKLGPGLHAYGGWFHFYGGLTNADASQWVEFGESLSALLVRGNPSPNLLPAGKGPLIQLDFQVNAVPWVLDEPEPG